MHAGRNAPGSRAFAELTVASRTSHEPPAGGSSCVFSGPRVRLPNTARISVKSHNHPLFLTTAIPYVNAAPHVGHALELLIGDALTRHYRQRGRDVLFTGGTDDHSAKNARAAAALGIPTPQLVSRHGDVFKSLAPALGVALDDYLHTSRDARHAPAVFALWQRCAEAGDLYQREYTGLYCTGCEAFVSASEQQDGRCPWHLEPLEHVSETNWFFRLSRYQAPLLEALERGELQIEPPERRREVESFVRRGLHDFSVSRARKRSQGYGLAVPRDPEQVVYVWFDALANYLSLLGFPDTTPRAQRFWSRCLAAREHLIGKDILRFHAVYWPALLLSAGLPVPTKVRVHGYVTARGEKLSKSSGNVIDPFGLCTQYGSEAVRYYCLRYLHTTKDSDFREERLQEAHDTDLAGKLGNLLQRTIALALRHAHTDHGSELRLDATAPSTADEELRLAGERAVTDVSAAVDGFALHEALASCLELVAAANRYADDQAPWLLSRRVVTSAEASARSELLAQLRHVLFRLCEALRLTALLIAPFLPETARRIGAALGLPSGALESLEWARFGRVERFRLRQAPPLFPRIKGRT